MSWVVILIKMTFSIALPTDWLHGEIVIFYVLADQLFIDDLLYVLVEFYTVYSLRISDIFRATYEYVLLCHQISVVRHFYIFIGGRLILYCLKFSLNFIANTEEFYQTCF